MGETKGNKAASYRQATLSEMTSTRKYEDTSFIIKHDTRGGYKNRPSGQRENAGRKGTSPRKNGGGLGGMQWSEISSQQSLGNELQAGC